MYTFLLLDKLAPLKVILTKGYYILYLEEFQKSNTYVNMSHMEFKNCFLTNDLSLNYFIALK